MVASGRIEPGAPGQRTKQGRHGRGPAGRAATNRPRGPTGRQRKNDSEANRNERRHELERDDAATDASAT